MPEKPLTDKMLDEIEQHQIEVQPGYQREIVSQLVRELREAKRHMAHLAITNCSCSRCKEARHWLKERK